MESDCCACPHVHNGFFAGTLDALLCGDCGEEDAARLLAEAWRLLAPGAAYVMITSAAPRARLKYLQQRGVAWARVQVYEVGQQGARSGPHDAADAAAMAALPHMSYSHFVYACTKGL